MIEAKQKKYDDIVILRFPHQKCISAGTIIRVGKNGLVWYNGNVVSDDIIELM